MIGRNPPRRSPSGRDARQARLPRLAALGALGVLLCGFVTRPLTSAEQALSSHHTNNDPAWALLRDAEVKDDKAKGVMTATFPAALQARAGKAFQISGYMTPLEDDVHTRHFIVTRRDTTCPFCPPNTPTEAVEVFLTRPIAVTPAEIAVAGRLELVASSQAGLFYRIADASPVSDSRKPWVSSRAQAPAPPPLA